MNLSGVFESLVYTSEGRPRVTFELDRVGDINDISKLKPSSPYQLKVKDKNKRSNPQNGLLWAIIRQIDIGLNGYPTQEGEWEIYTYGIEEAGVEYEDFEIPKGAISIMREGNRACRVLHEYDNGRVVLRCFTGSSKFNKKQMGELIDWFLRYAAKHGIPIQDYRNGMY